MVENAGLGSIESRLNESTVRHNGAEEVTAFVRVIRSFLAFDPDKRPHAVEALCDPVFKFIERCSYEKIDSKNAESHSWI